MKGNELLDNMELVDARYIEAADVLPERKKRRNHIKWFAVAACFAFVMSMAITAEAVNGAVSNLLAPLYGGAQTELVDNVGVPAGASTTVNGYTLTAEAVIGDKYNIAIVYSLTRADGKCFDEMIYFEDSSNSFMDKNGSGIYRYDLSEDGTKIQIVEIWSSVDNLFLNRDANVIFTNLMKSDGEDKILVAEGEWNLRFTLRYNDTSVNVPVSNMNVQDAVGKRYQIEKITLSQIGVHVDFTMQKAEAESSIGDVDFTLSVVLTDDTVIDVSGGFACSIGSDDTAYKGDYGAFFDEPIPMENIKALIICGSTLEV